MTITFGESDVNRTGHVSKQIEDLKRQLAAKENSLSLVVFSGELDKMLAAFTIATGAAACGMKVSMFLTFWATAAMKKSGPQAAGKGFVERLFGWMLPGGFTKQKLSKLDMFGIGRRMMFREMARKNVANLEQLVETADELGVEFYVCESSMSLMGIQCEELVALSNVKCCGVATFLQRSALSNTTLFI
ncbi:MAG: DsrE/DsrF/DrsH-like family protein [Planctomycetales bacterium]|nr:DsrE/DsrF/DrsH-like family protein [Planctomycetales bacterium]